MPLKLVFKPRTDLSTIGRGSTRYWRNSTSESRDLDQCSPSRSWIAVGSLVEDIRNEHLQNKCASWDADSTHPKPSTNYWFDWGQIQSKSFMCRDFYGLHKQMLNMRFYFGGCLIIWGNHFVPEVNPNFGWFFNLKARDHHPPMSLCAFRSCQILWTNKSSGGCWASHFIMLSFFPPFHKVRAPYVRIRNRTLGQLFFTFPSALTWWTPDYEP
jgi:hypothetical protein